MSADTTVHIGPLHNIRLRRPYIPKQNFTTQYGGYLTLLITTVIILYVLLRGERVLFGMTKLHAHWGDKDAQFQLGQHYLQGHGTKKNVEDSMHWFKRASDQGHPHAGYNLAYGHIRRMHSLLNKGDAAQLIATAAEAGIEEAKHALKYVCGDGFCTL